MSDEALDTQTASLARSVTARSDLVPVVFRAVAVLFLAPSGALKLVDYGGQAALFADLGIPAAGITVVAVAVLELVASGLLAAGVQARAGALLTIPIMLVAIALVGPVVSNVAVLGAAIGVLALGPGRYTAPDPVSS